MGELQEHLNVGLAFAMSKRWDEAAREFEAAALAGPSDPEAYFQLGKAYQSLGLSAKAEVALRHCCELDSGRIEARARLGQVLSALGRRDEAETVLREALAKDSGSVLALNSLGDVLMGKGQLEPAAAAWERTLAAQPDQPEAQYKLGFAYETMGKLDQALGRYLAACQLQPQRLPLRLALAGLYEKMDKLQEAAAAWGDVVGLRPQDSAFLYHWANALERAGDQGSAQAVLEQVLQLDASNAEAARRLAWSKVGQGDNSGAEQWMKIAALGLPEGVEKDLAGAWMHQMAGRMEEAVKAYRGVTEAEPGRADAWEALANLLYRRSDFSGAEAAFAKLVALKPDHVEAWTRVGSLNLKLGRRDAALKAWEEALRLDPKNAIVRKNLSVLKG